MEKKLKVKINKKIGILAMLIILVVASIVVFCLLNSKKIEISENSQNSFLAAGTPVSVDRKSVV